MKPYSLDLREKIVESVKKGVPKSETARRFGVDRATVKRYCKQFDERGTLEAKFLFAVSGVSVSEATICRAVRRLNRSRKKDPRGRQNGTSS